jgi:hypothetical protein
MEENNLPESPEEKKIKELFIKEFQESIKKMNAFKRSIIKNYLRLQQKIYVFIEKGTLTVKLLNNFNKVEEHKFKSENFKNINHFIVFEKNEIEKIIKG